MLGDVIDSIALLMDAQLAVVTYHDLILLLVVSFIANHAFYIFIFLPLLHNCNVRRRLVLQDFHSFVRIMVVPHLYLHVFSFKQSFK